MFPCAISGRALGQHIQNPQNRSWGIMTNSHKSNMAAIMPELSYSSSYLRCLSNLKVEVMVLGALEAVPEDHILIGQFLHLPKSSMAAKMPELSYIVPPS